MVYPHLLSFQQIRGYSPTLQLPLGNHLGLPLTRNRPNGQSRAPDYGHRRPAPAGTRPAG